MPSETPNILLVFTGETYEFASVNDIFDELVRWSRGVLNDHFAQNEDRFQATMSQEQYENVKKYLLHDYNIVHLRVEWVLIAPNCIGY